MVTQAQQLVLDVTLAIEPLVVVAIHAKDKLHQEKKIRR
jgi:hypothetical protein